MKTMLINLVASTLARLSLPINHRIGAGIGWLAWITRSELRTVSLINLSLCFPDWPEEEKQRIAKASLIETGKTLTESFWLWKRPRQDALDRVEIVQGEQLLRGAQQSDQGLIVAVPHLGSWESCCLPLATDELIDCLYKSPRNSAMEPLIIAGRENVGGDIVRFSPSGVKRLLRKLKTGHTVGILPDQEPDADNGQFAPFFAQSGNTMTLLAKIARNSNAQVLFCFAKRLPAGAGWQMHFLPCSENVKSSDTSLATIALNQAIEQCVLMCPEQYIWNYKRFRICTDGSRRNYSVIP